MRSGQLPRTFDRIDNYRSGLIAQHPTGRCAACQASIPQAATKNCNRNPKTGGNERRHKNSLSCTLPEGSARHKKAGSQPGDEQAPRTPCSKMNHRPDLERHRGEEGKL